MQERRRQLTPRRELNMYIWRMHADGVLFGHLNLSIVSCFWSLLSLCLPQEHSVNVIPYPIQIFLLLRLLFPVTVPWFHSAKLDLHADAFKSPLFLVSSVLVKVQARLILVRFLRLRKTYCALRADMGLNENCKDRSSLCACDFCCLRLRVVRDFHSFCRHVLMSSPRDSSRNIHCTRNSMATHRINIGRSSWICDLNTL